MAKAKLPEGFDWRAITPEDSPMTPMDMMENPRNQRLMTARLKEQEPAFFFTRPLFDYSRGTRIETGKTFDLAAVSAEKPVVLIFGSYT